MHVRYFLVTHYFYSIILIWFVHLNIMKFVIILFHQVALSFFYGVEPQNGPWYPHSWEFCHTQRRSTVNKLLRTSDRLDAETSTWQNTTLTTHIHDPVGFKPTMSAVLRPRGHWDRHFFLHSDRQFSSYWVRQLSLHSDRQFSLYSPIYVQTFALLLFF